MAVHLQLPECPRRKPVVVVSVENNGGVVVDAGVSQQLLHLRLGRNVAHQRVAQLRRPVPADGAGDMSLVVGGRIDVHFRNPDGGIGKMLADPIGSDQNVCSILRCHICLLLSKATCHPTPEPGPLQTC